MGIKQLEQLADEIARELLADYRQLTSDIVDDCDGALVRMVAARLVSRNNDSREPPGQTALSLH